MVYVIRSPLAERDIIEAIQYTKERWGEAQARRYRDLIQEALSEVATNPQAGRPFSDSRPGIFAYRIRQPGRPARHILFYRVTSARMVKVLRLLHDARDFDLHLL